MSTFITSLDNLHQDEAVSGYLGTMVRRHAVRLAKAQRRTRHTSERETDVSAIEERVLARERAQELRRAFAQLRPSDQQLLGLLVSDEEHSFVDIASMVGCPIGSIGPARRRALERLADLLDVATV